LPRSQSVPAISYFLLKNGQLFHTPIPREENAGTRERGSNELVIVYVDLVDTLAEKLKKHSVLTRVLEGRVPDAACWRPLTRDLESELRAALSLFKVTRKGTVLVPAKDLDEFRRDRNVSEAVNGMDPAIGKRRKSVADAGFRWVAEMLVKTQPDLVQLLQELDASSISAAEQPARPPLVAQSKAECVKEISAADARLKQIRKSLSFPYNLFAR